MYYYRRIENFSALSFRIPYIVKSRQSNLLLQRLQQDRHPILMEGIHCTYLLHSGHLKNRKVFVRLHNVEYKYYAQLASHEPNFLKRAYFNIESRLLKKYEASIATKAIFWAVSDDDVLTYRTVFNATVYFLPVFLPWQALTVKEGLGTYCLYHGNLSVNENEKAAEWLIANVFAASSIPFVIAGKNPSAHLATAIKRYPHISLVANPGEVEMLQLVVEAQVNILPSFNDTGVKLKLLNALFNGRHCIVNNAAVHGSGLDGCCNIVERPGEYKAAIEKLFSLPFSAEELKERSAQLLPLYSQEANTKKVIAWIY